MMRWFFFLLTVWWAAFVLIEAFTTAELSNARHYSMMGSIYLVGFAVLDKLHDMAGRK